MVISIPTITAGEDACVPLQYVFRSFKNIKNLHPTFNLDTRVVDNLIFYQGQALEETSVRHSHSVSNHLHQQTSIAMGTIYDHPSVQPSETAEETF